MQLTPSEQLAYSTVRIECLLADSSISTGTGFFFRFAENKDSYVPVIVTNKHVVTGAVSGTIHLNLADDQGFPIPSKYQSFTLDQFERRWIPHPESNVDLCVMLIGPLAHEAKNAGVSIFYFPLYNALIAQETELEQFTAIEDIIMIGYPNGIWDSVNNMPIIRKGITATHPNLNYEGKHEFMIDAACFPGSSGSPVFLFNLGAYATRDGNTAIGTRIKLLGILYAGPQHTATGDIAIVNIPTTQRPVAISRIPNNLGLVIKSYKLTAFETPIQQLLSQQNSSTPTS